MPYSYKQAGYAVWKAMADYHFDPQWAVTLNVNNLFDRIYYRTLAGWLLGRRLLR